MLRFALLLAAVSALLLAGCARETRFAFEVDILALVPSDDRSSTLSLTTLAGVEAYLPCSDSSEPCDGQLVEFDIDALADIFQSASLEIALGFDWDVSVSDLTVKVYIGAANDVAPVLAPLPCTGLFCDANLWDSLTASSDPVISLEAERGSRVGDLIVSGAFRLGLYLEFEAPGAQPGDAVTVTLEGAKLALTVKPGGLLP